jgi:peptide/nickel transport system substrate-binding protein
MKKLLVVLLLVLAVGAFVFATGTPAPAGGSTTTTTAAPVIKNPDTFVYGTIGNVDTLDPNHAYDNASGTNIRQLYEPLVYYDRDKLSLVPVLATAVPTRANGGISADGRTYTFTIRQGVKFHNGGTLTAEDVEYSIERILVINDPDGPGWMYWVAFFDDFGNDVKEDGSYVYSYEDIDKVVEATGNTVTFTIKQPFEPFLGILTGYWGSIVDKEWMIANGDWDGTKAGMEAVYQVEKEAQTLYEQANGTGPYKLERWVQGDEVVVTRFDGYWGPKPALRQGIYKVVSEWSTRKLMFLQGDLDWAYVEPAYYAEMDQEPNLVVQKDLPSLSLTGIQFNLAVNTQDNPLTGSNVLDGNGVPGDFFADKNVRLAFLSAWDEETFLRDVGAGTMMDPVTPFPFGLAYKNEGLERPPHDLNKAAEYLKAAWGGQLWDKGFKLELAYNEGNEVRGTALRILSENISSLNPKFDLSVRAVQWPEYLDLLNNRRMPIFSIGWAPDYPDVDNYAGPFMESTGHYSRRGSYNNPEVDRLVQEARFSTDPAVRERNYYRLQEIYLEDAVGIMTHQSLSRRYYRDWVKIQGGHFYQAVDSDMYTMLRYLSKSN